MKQYKKSRLNRNRKNRRGKNNKRNIKGNNQSLCIITDGITPRNELFEKICLMKQHNLKSFLKNEMIKNGKEVIEEDGFLFVKGNTPILLVAHLDTVHKELPREIVYANGTISSSQGIGADDRAGVYMILEILKHHDCYVLFCEDEEVGCIGSGKFCKSPLAKKYVGKFSYLIEVDRMNGNDAVFYDCDNPDFETFITQEHWNTAIGSYTDIVELSPVLEAASVNFSCGYYNAHTKDEYLVLNEMETNIKEICKLIERTEFDCVYEYIENDLVKYLNSDIYSNCIDGDSIFYIMYYEDDGVEQIEELFADTLEEAIAYFLIDHDTLTYDDIVYAMTEDEYYEYCKLFM